MTVYEGTFGCALHPPGSYRGDVGRLQPLRERALSVQEALNLYTRNAAWSSFDDERGSLESHKIADMVLLDRNPLATPPAELRSISVKGLFLSGRPCRPGQGRAELLARGLFSRRAI